MITIIILILIYLLSVVLNYLYLKLAHSKNGIYEHINIELPDLCITFFPVLNTMAVIMCYIFYLPFLRKPSNFNKFFKVKK